MRPGRRAVAASALVLAACSVAPARAQCPDTVPSPGVTPAPGEGVLWGVVREEGTCRPVARARITLELARDTLHATSDSLGRYVIHHIERNAPYRMTARASAGRPERSYFREARETAVDDPNTGVRYDAPDGSPLPRPGFVQRLDFWMRVIPDHF